MVKFKTSYGKWQVPYDMSKWHEHIEGYSITGCAALSESNLVFVFTKGEGSGPDIKLIRFFRDEKKQFTGEVLENIERIGYIAGLDMENALWISNVGDVFILGKDKDKSDFESPIPDRNTDYGYRTIKGLDRIQKDIYAVGGWRHVFMRSSMNKWVNISKNLDRSDIIDNKSKGWKTKKVGNVGFNSIGGVSNNNLYAGGDGADCWHYNGKDWQRIDLPTNADIYKIVAIDTNLTYMACSGGILLEGNKDNWKVIKRSGEKDQFIQLVQFKGSIYVATLFHMYQLVDGKLEECSPSKHNDDIDLMCHHYLSANDDIMLMCNEKSAAIFDGENWFPLITRTM